MENFEYLPKIVILLSTAIFIVVIFRYIKFSPVLGYLVAGALIGENGLSYIDSKELSAFAEFGVVFLLFAIGLELTIEKVIAMRSYVFGFGTLQMLLTSVAIGGFCCFLGLPVKIAVIIGGGLSLSSTAIVLKVISDNNTQNTQVGRIAIANLLLQDFAVVPLLVLLQLLAKGDSNILLAIGSSTFKAFVVMISIFFVGRIVIKPLFGLISKTNSNEIFIATTLLIVLASSLLTEIMNLSLAMGAFIAGLLVAETRYQNEVEEKMMPFKDLLMGLFFMTVGMTINLETMSEQAYIILLLCFLLIVFKAGVIIFITKMFRISLANAIHCGLLLSQGSEFAFILFRLAATDEISIISQEILEILLTVVTLSMALTPLLSVIGSFISDKFKKQFEKISDNSLNELDDLSSHVIIAGFNETGEIIARSLAIKKINFIILETDPHQLKNAKEKGFPVYRINPTVVSEIENIALERAKAVIVTFRNKKHLMETVSTIHNFYTEIPIVVRSDDLKDYKKLKEIGATIVVQEKYEAGLQITGALLKAVGISEYEINKLQNQFRSSNYNFSKQIQAQLNDT